MNNEEIRNYYLRFKRFQQSREKFFAPLIFKAIRDQYRHVIEARSILAIDGIHAGKIASILKDLYVDAATVYGAKVRADLVKHKARMPMGFSQRMLELITQYFQMDILNTSNDITNTTKDLIREVFTNAYSIGLGIDDIIQQLEDTELSKIRARLIARTETVTSANAGARVVAKETGLMLNKRWLATQDSRTRHTHRFIDGQIVGLDDYFTLDDGVKILQPGGKTQENGLPVPAEDVINCRCTTLYLPIRDNGKLVRA